MKTKVIFSSLLCLMMAQNLFAELPQRNNLSPQLKASLSDKILSKDEIMQGADRSQNIYFTCLSETSESIKKQFPNANKDMLINITNATCENPEDLFNVYNILLASSSMNKPMSEKQASVFIENAYKKNGREKTNEAVRAKVLKDLRIIE
ncbi:hypothetical protein [Acinetobacter gerneri]|uniref:DUF2059 domain-containing protein n=1 Tax=Acinetobacter gerneri DSM 14967 = CIP 107464 = MTCC 9824 TaxID=1120926 RepID=N8ZF00_9GAMM|nr:hypothetical protein [Acinetobacter gerneri]ENV32329.1 hypothetical protein F960_03723 [Acinetobacter gerneri DSM 14967 = CIP 107464 = MTCC 9824]